MLAISVCIEQYHFSIESNFEHELSCMAFLFLLIQSKGLIYIFTPSYGINLLKGMGKTEKSKLGYCSWLGFGGDFLFLLVSSLLSYRCIGNQIGRTG